MGGEKMWLIRTLRERWKTHKERKGKEATLRFLGNLLIWGFYAIQKEAPEKEKENLTLYFAQSMARMMGDYVRSTEEDKIGD